MCVRARARQVRRLVEHLTLGRYAPQMLVCAAVYIERLAAADERRATPAAAAAAAAASAAAAAPASAAAAAVALPPAALERDLWQVVLLAALTLASKTYSDRPETTAGLLDGGGGSSVRAGWALCTGPALHAAEFRLLRALGYRTVVAPPEFAAMAFGDDA